MPKKKRQDRLRNDAVTDDLRIHSDIVDAIEA